MLKAVEQKFECHADNVSGMVFGRGSINRQAMCLEITSVLCHISVRNLNILSDCFKLDLVRINCFFTYIIVLYNRNYL